MPVVLLEQERRDEEAAEHEEEVDAEEAALGPAKSTGPNGNTAHTWVNRTSSTAKARRLSKPAPARAAGSTSRHGASAISRRPAVVGLAARAALDHAAPARPPSGACSGPRARRPTARRSSSVGRGPSRSCTTATTSWPHRSLGRPTTTTSNTSGWRLMACSTSSANTFSPPVLMVTESRPEELDATRRRARGPGRRPPRGARRRPPGRCGPSSPGRRGSRAAPGRSGRASRARGRPASSTPGEVARTARRWWGSARRCPWRRRGRGRTSAPPGVRSRRSRARRRSAGRARARGGPPSRWPTAWRRR